MYLNHPSSAFITKYIYLKYISIRTINHYLNLTQCFNYQTYVIIITQLHDPGSQYHQIHWGNCHSLLVLLTSCMIQIIINPNFPLIYHFLFKHSSRIYLGFISCVLLNQPCNNIVSTVVYI